MKHLHSAEHRVWERTFEGEMKLHPYCSECGVLKNVSGDRGKKFSYFVIALSRLRKILNGKGYKVSEAQMRLILKELSDNEDFCDVWWITFSRQKEIFIRVVRNYIKASPHLINSVL